MIKIKNTSEFLLLLDKSGVAGLGTSQDYFIAPFAGKIKAIYAVFGLMGTDGTGSPTQDVIVDIMKNGTTIFSGAGKLSWAHAGQLGTANTPTPATSYAALTTNPPSVAKGDKIRVDTTQLLNGTGPTQPSDLMVYITLERSRGQSPTSATLTGQIDEND